jgi:NAD-dependent dihydropyrimidine dehydrogenase PreA subunit
MSVMHRLHELLLDTLQTGFRFFPWPTEPGLRRIGNPDASSPVLLTGNYDLTVRRLTRALAFQNVWLVVAPSAGINVWCASSGGHLSSHQVVTALKTSGIAERVDHRSVILPQLAATGVLALDVFRRSRWRVRFGPVHLFDIPNYLETGEKTDAMRRVRFPLRDRLEMAMAWAVPTALVLGGVMLFLKAAWALPLVALIAGMSIAVFTLYDRLEAWTDSQARLILCVVSAGLAVTVTAINGATLPALIVAALAPVLLTALLTFDYAGSTPLEGGSHFEERKWTISFDADLCDGIFRCWEVCPEACFEKHEEIRKVELAHDDRCIRCGACVAQCPKDALFFEDPNGVRIEPETIRKFKLNLLGKRNVEASRTAD